MPNLKPRSYKTGFQQLPIKDEVKMFRYSLELTECEITALGASKIHRRCVTRRSSFSG